jgi:hypothetical protein
LWTHGLILVGVGAASVDLPLCDDCSAEADRDPEFRTAVEVVLMAALRRDGQVTPPV